MPPELIAQIEEGIQGAVQGVMSQLQIAIGDSPENSRTVRIVVLPDFVGKMKDFKEMPKAEAPAAEQVEQLEEENQSCGAPV